MDRKNILYAPKESAKFIGEVTEAQVKKWKAEHKDGIYGATVKGRIVYFRYPDLNDLNCAYAKLDKTRVMDKWKELADVTFLGGDEEVLNNDRLFISIVDKIQAAAQAEESELVNL
jgi:hypothetical protein